jgi:hypoxanthine phosphoribosyltransferase
VRRLIILFTEEQIRVRISQLAAEIDADYVADAPLHFVGILRGAFVFLSDLVRAITRPVTLDFIEPLSYGAATKRSGEVQLVKDLDIPLRGRDVIVVVDVVDTGLMLLYLHGMLRARNPKSLKTACLLRKPSRCKVEMAIDYVGFDIEDIFVVGYGLDHSGQDRHLPFIGIRDDSARHV